jgi:hypothetical protein
VVTEGALPPRTGGCQRGGSYSGVPGDGGNGHPEMWTRCQKLRETGDYQITSDVI